MGRYKFLGKPTPRKDALDIVTGRAIFLDDIKLSEMLIGKVLRSPHPHAIIKDIKVEKAKKLPGVKAILTYKDVPDWKMGIPSHLRPLDKKVRFVGDAVALVAATEEEIALEALDLIEVEYEPLLAVYDVEEAIRPGAPQLYEEFPNNILPLGNPWFGSPKMPEGLKELVFGNVEKGFEEADTIVEGTFSYENIPNPLPPEPPGVIAYWEDPSTVHVWLTSQGIYMDKISLYYIMKRKFRVIVHGPQCGGSYGSKGTILPIAIYTILLAKEANKPVKLTYTKEEHLATFTLRLGSRIRGKVGMKKDGTVTAIKADWFVNTGHYSAVTQAQVMVGLGEAQLVIRCPNWDIRPKIVCTNRASSGWIRGFGGQELKSALLPLLYLAMAKLDVDPVEFFKKNVVKAGDGYFWRDGEWWVSRVIDFTKAIDAGARVFGWKERWRGWLKPTEIRGSKRIGVGVGVHGNADVGEDVAEAYMRIDPDETCTLYVAVPEQGGGQRSNLCKIAAEVLQIPPERIFVSPSESEVNPYEFGLVGSRGTYAIGSAVIRAAKDVKRQLFLLAAEKLNVSPEELDTEDAIIYVKNHPEKRISWRKAMGTMRTLIGYGRFEPDYSLCNFMVCFVEIEVDTETGRAELTRVVNATDVGQIIDQYCLENQLNGCLGSAGIDTALFEETVFDTKLGRILTTDMVDYKWRVFRNLPEINNVILETPFPTHDFGAVGVGEISTSPGPAACVMAISNAIGKWLLSYPATPDKILEALQKKEAC
ncbi:MAG: xanthine dehydrogenase family protein molybdopterin-binding subunit [Desulfobacterota bacterium]|nr:xanthine dehydrogenase family protein molybdopterin-binding subunit [Thermodesulfobacteriota bacterium]MDW8002530.1 xanthine dehydrogenase family protein molybdopterin-binding subunit [Deltaproteobacteria bacterium]